MRPRPQAPARSRLSRRAWRRVAATPAPRPSAPDRPAPGAGCSGLRVITSAYARSARRLNLGARESYAYGLRRGKAVQQRTTVLVVEDDAIVRAWVRLALEGRRVPGRRRGSDDRGRARPRLTPARRPAARRPSASGSIRHGVRAGAAPERRPDACGDDRGAAEPGLNESAREAGAQGSVLKRGSAEELLDALRRVAGGEERSTAAPRRAVERRCAEPARARGAPTAHDRRDEPRDL